MSTVWILVCGFYTVRCNPLDPLDPCAFSALPSSKTKKKVLTNNLPLHKSFARYIAANTSASTSSGTSTGRSTPALFQRFFIWEILSTGQRRSLCT